MAHLAQEIYCRIGKAGCAAFPAGDYLYFGTAFGPGGLRARIKRHLRMEKKKFWHFDYIREFITPKAIFYSLENDLECEWCQAVLYVINVRIPMPAFGAKDCRRGCPAHFLLLESLVSLSIIADTLRSVFPTNADLVQIDISTLENTVQSALV